MTPQPVRSAGSAVEAAAPREASRPGVQGGSAALWDRLIGRGPVAAGVTLPPLPQGTGPLVWLRLDAATPRDGGPAGQLAAVLRKARPGLRLILTHPQAPAPQPPDPGEAGTPRTVPGTFGPTLPDPGPAPEGLRAFLDHVAPAVLVMLGPDLPEALLLEAERLRLPVVLADADLARAEGARRAWPWTRVRSHHHLARIERMMVPDHAAEEAAMRLGASPERVEVTGPLTETRRPLGCAEAERAAIAAALRGRQTWFAAAVPEAEDEAVLAAHRKLLGHTHRALLILAPDRPGRAPALMARLEEEGFAAALRSDMTEEPEPELQVVVADDPGEMGLWYRVAPVSYFGGTLLPSAEVPRHPFEAAALGSAILHGPFTGGTVAGGWSELRQAGATREVRRADELGPALDELIAPDRAADCAARAWAVSTAGAAVAQRIAAVVVELLG